MEINNIHNNLLLGRILTGSCLKEKLSNPKCPKNFINSYIAIKKESSKQGLTRTKNIDIVLDYNNADGYYASVIPKKAI